ncbi:MAG: hypothetical protein JSW20_07425 [Nitrospiraceae bacterium]|nr:MAG: hypothetical protein JSW20_07425 [Nitrospiraceae bacterium]
MNIQQITDYSRTKQDRRVSPTPIISKYSIKGGRRRIVRRNDDKTAHIFVDLYSTRLFMIVLSLLFLSLFDAYMTLTLISKGKVYEANPFMAYFLDHGILHFTVVKLFITIASICILCIFKNVRLTRIGLPVAIKIYILIVAYECYLFMI